MQRVISDVKLPIVAAVIAQLVERLLAKEKVASSSLVYRSNQKIPVKLEFFDCETKKLFDEEESSDQSSYCLMIMWGRPMTVMMQAYQHAPQKPSAVMMQILK